MDIEIKRPVLHELCSFVLEELSGGAGACWWLGWHGEVELFEQDFVIGLWLGAAAQDQEHNGDRL
jgi:hypothetical protein